MSNAMSTTLLRLGLWTLILVLALYVLAETYRDEAWAEMIPMPMLQQTLAVAGIVIVLGIVARLFDKGARVVNKNRCRVCRTPIPAGAIYCREHLRNILSEEDEKTHATRVRRR
jgi:predicted nucleic acid-binding Zn ribbon protein